MLYIGGAVSGITVLWHFYKAEYRLSQTEILLLESFRRLPFYWPPGPKPAVKNSRIDGEGLPADLVGAFAEWFMATDLLQPEGVTRDDVLELVVELGFSDTERPCKDFLARGDGELEEQRRLTGAGLQESVSLLAKLRQLPKVAELDGEASPRALLGDEAVALLRRKLSGFASVMSAARAMQQAMPLVPSVLDSPAQASGAGLGGGFGVGVPGSGVLPEEDEEMGEAQMREMEEARLVRLEADYTARLARHGSLSPGEEARYQDVLRQRAELQSGK